MEEFRSYLSEQLASHKVGQAFRLEDVMGSRWPELDDNSKRQLGKDFFASVSSKEFGAVCPTEYPMKPAQEYVRYLER